MDTAIDYLSEVCDSLSEAGHDGLSLVVGDTLQSYLSEADAMDVACALYWFAGANHSGQWSAGYALSCIVGRGYTPGRMERGPEVGSMAEMMVHDLAASCGSIA